MARRLGAWQKAPGLDVVRLSACDAALRRRQAIPMVPWRTSNGLVAEASETWQFTEAAHFDMGVAHAWGPLEMSSQASKRR